jgi:hypothetical protein
VAVFKFIFMSDPSPLPNDPGAADESEKASHLTERLKTIAGLVAVIVGVVAVTAIALLAIALTNGDPASIASSAGGVIATIVGAYFGVKSGTDRANAAGENQKAEAAKAQVYALHLPAEKAPEVIRQAEAAAAQAINR